MQHKVCCIKYDVCRLYDESQGMSSAFTASKLMFKLWYNNNEESSLIPCYISIHLHIKTSEAEEQKENLNSVKEEKEDI